MNVALDALLAAGWRPEPHPDAISAAEARGRREGIEAAAERLNAVAWKSDSEMRAYYQSAAEEVECLLPTPSIPPQEAPK